MTWDSYRCCCLQVLLRRVPVLRLGPVLAGKFGSREVGCGYVGVALTQTWREVRSESISATCMFDVVGGGREKYNLKSTVQSWLLFWPLKDVWSPLRDHTVARILVHLHAEPSFCHSTYAFYRENVRKSQTVCCDVQGGFGKRTCFLFMLCTDASSRDSSLLPNRCFLVGLPH